MNSIRFLVVKLLVVVLASTICTLANAENSNRPSGASARLADYFENPQLLAAAPDGNADGFQRASSGPAAVIDQPTPVADLVESTPPSLSTRQYQGPNECCDYFCNDPCPAVYGQVEALFLQRDPRLIDQPIVVDANTGETFLSTSDLNYNYDPGLRATIGRRLCGGHTLEFSYFGLFQGTASDIAVQPDPAAFLIFPDNFFGNVFVGMDRAEANYSSSLHSAEVNLLCCCGCCEESCGECGCCDCGCPELRCRSVEWFAGIRYLNLSEELNILAQRTEGGGLEEGSYDIRTANNLYGVQLGARVRRTQGQFGWEATGKAGIFGNDAQQEQSVTDFPNFPIRPIVSSSSGGVAFVGEANLSALYRLNDIWNLRGGYNIMWIEGVALAPDQLDFDFAAAAGGERLNHGGGMFLHGFNLGVEARW